MSAEEPTVDELLEAPLDHLGLPETSIPVHAVLIVEVVNLGNPDEPVSLYTIADHGLSAWSVLGMLSYADVLCRAMMAPPPEG